LLQSHSAVKALAHFAAVLTAAVQAGHNDRHAVCLARHSLDQTLEVGEVVVRGHMVLVPEQLVRHAVVARVHHDEDVIAPHRILDHALGVAALEAGALAGDDKAPLLHAALCSPPHQVAVDQVGQFLCTGTAQQAQICNAATLCEDILGFDHIGHFYGSFNSSLPVLCLFHTERIMPFSFYHILAPPPVGFSIFCALHS